MIKQRKRFSKACALFLAAALTIPAFPLAAMAATEDLPADPEITVTETLPVAEIDDEGLASAGVGIAAVSSEDTSSVKQISLPIRKIVTKVGEENPTDLTVSFELTNFMGNVDPSNLTISGNTITTTGEGVYEGTMVITTDIATYYQLSFGFSVQEAYIDEPYWYQYYEVYDITSQPQHPTVPDPGTTSIGGGSLMAKTAPLKGPKVDIDVPDVDIEDPDGIPDGWEGVSNWYYYRWGAAVSTLEFVNEYDKTTYTVGIPLNKTVTQTGKNAPGAETFAFELLFQVWNEDGSSSLEAMDLEGIEVLGSTIATNGVGDYPGTLSLTTDNFRYYDLQYGFFIREKQGNAEGWTYDDTLYYVEYSVDYDDGGIGDVDISSVNPGGQMALAVVVIDPIVTQGTWHIFKVEDLDDFSTWIEVTTASFTNSYENTTYEAAHKFESGTADKELPEAVTALLPEIITGLQDGSDASATALSTTTVKVDGGTWTFTAWDAESKTVQGDDVEFVGTWTFTADPETDTTTPGNPDSGKNVPKTADPTHPGLWGALMTAALAGMALTLRRRKRSTQD